MFTGDVEYPSKYSIFFYCRDFEHFVEKKTSPKIYLHFNIYKKKQSKKSCLILKLPFNFFYT